jgi:hypothetical protein
MEIWRENSQTLFSGRQILGEPSAADPMGSDAIKAIYHKAVDQKRTQGYIAVKFNDSKRGGIPSFSSGEGERIAAAGIIDGGGLDVQSLSRESLEGAMKSFTERLERGWSGASNAKVLLAELRQIQQRVEAYCEASGQEADCSELRERLAATKAAVQAVLTA